MSLQFQELGGSPVEQYSLAGFTAKRRFLIPWEQRDAFAEKMLGQSDEFRESHRLAYPGKPTVVATQVHFEPFDADAVDARTLADLEEDLNTYTDALALAVVTYRSVAGDDRPDGPVSEADTWITYRMRFAAETLALAPRGWQWTDDATIPLPGDENIVKRIPITEHHLTWHQVVHPPWETIESLQGTVNDQPFLGCPAGTMLFEGADANKLYRAGLEEGPSPFAWEIRYLFRQRAIKSGGETFGWNACYREDPAGWVDLTNGSESLYDDGDFQQLFRSDMP
jgi:hypothetical protein